MHKSRRTWRTASIGVLCFTAIGLMFAAQSFFNSRSFGRPVTWGQTLKWSLGSWYLCALLSPAILIMEDKPAQLDRAISAGMMDGPIARPAGK